MQHVTTECGQYDCSIGHREGGRVVTIASSMAVVRWTIHTNPRTPAMTGRTTSSFHLSDRHRVHQALGWMGNKIRCSNLQRKVPNHAGAASSCSCVWLRAHVACRRSTTTKATAAGVPFRDLFFPVARGRSRKLPRVSWGLRLSSWFK